MKPMSICNSRMTTSFQIPLLLNVFDKIKLTLILLSLAALWYANFDLARIAQLQHTSWFGNLKFNNNIILNRKISPNSAPRITQACLVVQMKSLILRDENNAIFE